MSLPKPLFSFNSCGWTFYAYKNDMVRVSNSRLPMKITAWGTKVQKDYEAAKKTV